jgi:hypothetical protein
MRIDIFQRHKETYRYSAGATKLKSCLPLYIFNSIINFLIYTFTLCFIYLKFTVYIIVPSFILNLNFIHFNFINSCIFGSVLRNTRRDSVIVTRWTVWGSNLGGCEIFNFLPDRPRVSISLL